MIFDVVHRLEADPDQLDPARGWAAEVADPAWLLGRQWQLGEHLGEDASTPVRIRYRLRSVPIRADGVGSGPDVGTPLEAVLAAEPDDVWTVWRRVVAGRLVATNAAAAGRPLPGVPDAAPELLLTGLAGPYAPLNGVGYDGRALWAHRSTLALDPAWFGDLRPPEPAPAAGWDPAELRYRGGFRAGSLTLRHEAGDGTDGGPPDWFSVDATGQVPDDGDVETGTALAHRVRFPGAPGARWWQIEAAGTDPGGSPPDRSHVLTIVVTEVLANVSDDWFTVPVPLRPGRVTTLDGVVVVDSFGTEWPLNPPDDWTMFATTGLGPRSLVLWGGAPAPLVGPVLDEVLLGVDEDAELLWAVERRLAGQAVSTPPDPALPLESAMDTSTDPAFAYQPMSRIPPHWHPYPAEQVAGRRRFVQARAADLSGPEPTLLPAATSELLRDPDSGGVHPVHQIEPSAVPSTGLRVTRRAVLARRADARPVLWLRRDREPLPAPPAKALSFDVLLPDPGSDPTGN